MDAVINSFFHFFYLSIGIIFCFVCLIKLYCKITCDMYNDQQDMTGKTVLITGASSGIGKATAMDLAKRNARVILACRNIKKAEQVAEEIKTATGNQDLVVKHLELASFDSVRKCAKSVLETEDRLDVLVNNAGIVGSPNKYTEDGCEVTMQTNYFSHFFLTLLLLDLLQKSSPSRIVNVSSILHRSAIFRINDLNNEKDLHTLFVYSNTKLASILFTKELAKKLEGTGITVNSVHPGVINSHIIEHSLEKCDRSYHLSISDAIFMAIFQIIFFVAGKTPEGGAQPIVKLAVDPNLGTTTGKYFSGCNEATTSQAAANMKMAKQLFERSEEIVDLSFVDLPIKFVD